MAILVRYNVGSCVCLLESSWAIGITLERSSLFTISVPAGLLATRHTRGAKCAALWLTAGACVYGKCYL